MVTDADRDGSAAEVDCDDTDATASRTALVYEDLDSDGLGTGNGLSRCVGAVAPDGFSFAAGDCADNDAAVFTLRPYVATDRDSDGFIVMGSGSVCSGASLRAGYLPAIAGTATDCDDLDFSKWRMAAVYPDADGDGVGSGAFDVRCIGTNAAVGFSLLGYDPLDTLSDPSSAQVSDLELDVLNIVVDSDGDDD